MHLRTLSSSTRGKGTTAFPALAFVSLFAVLAIGLLSPTPAFGQAQILDVHEPLADFDSRQGAVQPSSTAKGIVASLGANASWNQFGTPRSLIKYGGYLATGLGDDAVIASKVWIRRNKALFRLSDEGVSNLELLNDSRMNGYPGHAVLFRQTFGGLPSTGPDGMITVGIVGGKVAYVSSSAVGDGNAPGGPSLTALQAWQKAAADVGRATPAANLTKLTDENGWTMLRAVGFSHPQRARLVAFPTIQNGVRPAYETIVLHNKDGESVAYTHFIDAQTGKVLSRTNRVQRFAATGAATALVPMSFTFSGSYGPPAPQDANDCGPLTPLGAHGPYAAPVGTQSIEVIASGAFVTQDIVIKLDFNTPGNEVASGDLLFSPEQLSYSPVPPGNYFVRICPFGPFPQEDPLYDYAGTITINDAASGDPQPFPPKWKFFKANPLLNTVNGFPWNNPGTDIRALGCWLSVVQGSPVPGCTIELYNLAARFPYDLDTRTNQPTFTTTGNAAETSRAWTSPLTPGDPYRPVSNSREYTFPFFNSWFDARCDRAAFNDPVEKNDADAAVTNLFLEHNRMHDWSYFLGFTEVNFNAQNNNFGNTAPGPFPAGREFDPEIGDAQAGALTSGSPTFLGRDNANQITLNDGVPPITNMYLWQPISAAFYAPCVDGDFDMAIIGHEYTHLISNRMVGGPDVGIGGAQGGAMGESWSDLSAVEYLNEFGFVPVTDENPFSVGAYATGNKQTAIRNYGMNSSPLNYSNVGYDLTGPQVHADGEIWSATNFEIRKALVTKYNASFPASNAALQKKCAFGEFFDNPDRCPGNRRWIQIMFDAWLLMPASPSMLDARDAYIAGDQARTGGQNKVELWRAFAKRGFGVNAFSATANEGDPTPGFETPVETNEATIKFRVVDSSGGGGIPTAQIFVGDFEARTTPTADTNPNTNPGTPNDEIGNTAKFVPGTYNFLVRAPGWGHVRFTRTFTANQVATLNVAMPANFASKTKGGAPVASLSDGPATHQLLLIDDTESTQWKNCHPTTACTEPQTPVGKRVTVDLHGVTAFAISRVQVSTLLNPGEAQRFTALRSFEVRACNEVATDCTLEANYATVFTSPANAFPGDVPRPVQPALKLKSFTLPAPVNATHLQLRVLHNQCTAPGTGFRGDQDNDVFNTTDCVNGSTDNPAVDPTDDPTVEETANNLVRVAEFQAFTSNPSIFFTP